MLPVHRPSAGSGSSDTSKTQLSEVADVLRSRKTWTSPLVTRIGFIAAAFMFAVWWLPRDLFLRVGPEGLYSPTPPPSDLYPMVSLEEWRMRADKVVKSFAYAYHAYERTAFPADELRPITNRPVQNFNGWGVTVSDSLSTMLMMGLTDEYKRGIAHVSTLNFTSADLNIPFFETTIRYLGGLLSAHALSGDHMLLTQADNLGQALIGAFNTTSGLPAGSINPVMGWGGEGGQSLLAEIASCQMEFKYLAHLTKRVEYFLKSDRVIELMERDPHPDGLWATSWNLQTGTQIHGHISIGGLADSAYEYLLKGYLLSGKSEKRLLDMYLKSVNGVIDTLMYISPVRNLLYVTDAHNNYPTHQLEHLSCFYPGLLALGLQTLELSPRDAERHRWAAEGLAHTCWLQYAESATGLGSENSYFFRQNSTAQRWVDSIAEWEKGGRKGSVPPGVKGPEPMNASEHYGRDYTYNNVQYLLRPETIETIYVMWRYTGDAKWRHRGWKIYEAIEQYTKTPYGYTSYWNIMAVEGTSPLDSMPSYFLAETLKYLYLLFSDQSRSLPVDKWIFNTEAHPLPVFYWTDKEKKLYNIQSL